MTTDKQDPSRKAFEAWLLNRYKPGSAQLQKDADGDYTNVYTLCEWAGWQASRKQALREAAQVCDDLSIELRNLYKGRTSPMQK